MWAVSGQVIAFALSFWPFVTRVREVEVDDFSGWATSLGNAPRKSCPRASGLPPRPAILITRLYLATRLGVTRRYPP